MLWFEILKRYWKHILGLVLVTSIAVTSFIYGRKSVAPQISVQEKIVFQEKIVTVEVEKKVTNKEKTTTVITRPDGTKEEVTVEKEKTEEESTKNNTSETSGSTESKPAVAKKPKEYRLGTFIETKPFELFSDPEKPTWGLSASKRLFSDLWADVTYNFGDKSATLGASWEF